MDAKTTEFILFEAHDSCRLWLLTINSIEGIRDPNLRNILGAADNAAKCRRLFDAIETSLFCELPAERSARGILPGFLPDQNARGMIIVIETNLRVFLLLLRLLSAVLRWIDRLLPSGQPTGWDVSVADLSFFDISDDLAQLWSTLSCWVQQEENTNED